MEEFVFKEGRQFSIPELSLCLSAFFLHFFWEVIHTYFYFIIPMAWKKYNRDWGGYDGRSYELCL
jgi:hypothetical protein